MATIFDINLETGDTSEFTSPTGVSAATAAAKFGTYGLSATISGTTILDARRDTVQATKLRYRFYVDPNSVSMVEGDSFTISYVMQGAVGFLTLLSFQLRYLSGSYNISAKCINDAAADVLNDSANISDDWHYIEFYEVQAATNVSSDGTCQWWIDGVDQGTITGIDNFNVMSDQVWRFKWGVDGSNGAGETDSGTVYFDAMKGNNDGGTIGAYVFAPAWAGSGAQTVTATPAATLTPALPTNWAVGDLLVMLVAGRSSGSTITNTFSNAWTLLNSQFFEISTGLNDLWIGVYTRVAATGEAAPTVTPDSVFLVAGAATGGISAQIAAFRNTSGEIDVAAAVNSNAAAATWTPPSVTTVTPYCLIVSCVATADDNALNFNTVNGFSLVMSGANYDTTTGSDHAVGMAFMVKESAGAVTMPVWNESAVGNDAWVGVTCAFRVKLVYFKKEKFAYQAVNRASFI